MMNKTSYAVIFRSGVEVEELDGDQADDDVHIEEEKEEEMDEEDEVAVTPMQPVATSSIQG